MVFSSTIFLFAFLPVVYIVNRFLPHKLSNAFLCITSLLFYAWGEPVYVLLMIASVLINYAFAKNMDQSPNKKVRLVWAVALNLAMLFVFKYTDFVVASLNSAFGFAIPQPNIPLPIGISFFTFQAMSYTIDVYRGVTNPQRSFLKLMLYVSFFPQLIAGPIVKYHDIAEQIDHRTLNLEDTAKGIRRFIIGLSKKVLIANVLAGVVDGVYQLSAGQLSLPVAWLTAVAYVLQLYYDFSGYSDMAIGLGHMFGFEFKENFNYPMISASLREFWQRWHISLSTWFKEYVYIPLGGNRKGKLRTGLNRVTVFFLTGLWHGAQWTFVIWGMIHGTFMLLEQHNIIPVNAMGKKTRWIGQLYTALVVVLAFVIFRAESFAQAAAMWGNMFVGGWDMGMQAKWFSPLFYTALVLGIIGCTPWVHVVQAKLSHKSAAIWAGCSYVAALALLVLCMLALAASTHNPFIYFRF